MNDIPASKRYGVALLAVAASTLLTFALRAILGNQSHYLTFTLAVMASAWYGGLGPGLVATASGFLFDDYFFIEPIYSLLPVQANDVALFTSVGVIVSILAGRLSSARMHLQIATRAAGVGTFDWFIAKDRMMWTPELARLYGLRPEKIKTTLRGFLDCVHADDAERVKQDLHAAMAAHCEEVVQEFRIVQPDGNIRWIEARIRLKYGVGGAPIRSWGAHIDVTERREREAERQKLNEVEQERFALTMSNEDLQRFAFAISHDLQQPLRTIGAFTELLSRRAGSALDEESQKLVSMIVKGVEQMRSLIQGLLTFSEVNYRDTAPPETVDSEIALRQALQFLGPAIAESQARITFDAMPKVAINRDQLIQVFLNLLSNAIRYRGDRPLEIRVAAMRQENGWRFSVADNGMGIDAKYHDEIFGIFRRLHSEGRISGTGIGLAVVRRIIERAGGSVWVDSEPDKGSTFYFTIRTAEESSPATAIPAHPSHEATRSHTQER